MLAYDRSQIPGNPRIPIQHTMSLESLPLAEGGATAGGPVGNAPPGADPERWWPPG